MWLGQCGGEASRFSKIERSSDIHAQYACDAAERCAAISRIVESPEVLVHVKGCEVAIARADASKHLAAASVAAREVRADLVQPVATDFRNQTGRMSVVDKGYKVGLIWGVG